MVMISLVNRELISINAIVSTGFFGIPKGLVCLELNTLFSKGSNSSLLTN
ncbi:hypothetical protein [Alkaliphilus serpentinus]|nr:hypothetical protein [Alkaliphilus serpentinus]